ncbi:MAG TPA: TetR/AcrR family transcriptional regulator [Dongiaceae bacterium]|nr:TetR/AcrR family transcriptional regulator [Dongiaceae bacterium]
MSAMGQAKLPGRPRCEETRAAILRAAYELLESGGLSAFTIEAVAERSGAAKTTIYRWWPNKGALAMESFLRVAERLSPFPETGSPRADLRAHLHLFARALRGRAGRLLAGIVAEAQIDPATRAAFVASYVAPRRQAARRLLERGVALGELRPDLDVESVCDALYGFFYMRLLFGHAPMDRAAVDRILDIVLCGIGRSDGRAA